MIGTIVGTMIGTIVGTMPDWAERGHATFPRSSVDGPGGAISSPSSQPAPAVPATPMDLMEKPPGVPSVGRGAGLTTETGQGKGREVDTLFPKLSMAQPLLVRRQDK